MRAKMHDEQVGSILQRLKGLGVEDNTIVIYSTDNGEPRWEQQLKSNEAWVARVCPARGHLFRPRHNQGLPPVL